MTKVKSKTGVILEVQKDKRQSVSLRWRTSVISRIVRTEDSTSTYARGDIMKDGSGSHAVFTKQGSSTSQMTAAKVMDVIAGLPECAGQAADAVSANPQVKMKDAPKLLKLPKSERQDVLDTSSTTHVAEIFAKHRRSCVSSWTKSEWSPTCWILVARTIWKKNPIGTWMGKGTDSGMLIRSSKKRGLFLSIYVDDKKWLEGSRISVPCGRNGWSWLIWENQHHSLNVNANRTKTWLKKTQRCSKHESLVEQLQNYRGGRNLTQRQSRGHTMWKDMRQSALKRCEKCQKYALELSWNLLFCHELVDQTRHSLSSVNFGTNSHKMDQTLWQTLGSFDFTHEQREWLQTVLPMWKYSTTLSTVFVPRLRLCWGHWRLREDSVYLGKSNIRSYKLDV